MIVRFMSARKPQPPPNPPPPPGNTNLYKFVSGDFLQTEAYEFGVSPSQWQMEQTTYLVPSPHMIGYISCFVENQLENTTLATNHNTNTVAGIDLQYPGFESKIEACGNDLWAHSPNYYYGCYLNFASPGTNAYPIAKIQQNWGALSNPPIPAYVLNCGGTLTVPTAFGSSTTTTGPVAPIYSGSSSYGLGFAAWNGSTAFSELVPAWWNPLVNQVTRCQLVQALSKYVLKTGPYAGLTLDQCPKFVLILTNDEWSFNMTASQNIPGITVNPPSTIGGAPSPTPANFAIGQFAYQRAVSTSFPHTENVPCISFGFDCIGLDSDASIAGYMNAELSGNGYSQIPGCTFGDSDTVSYDFGFPIGTAPYNANPAKAGYFGWASGIYAPAVQPDSLVGDMDFVAQCQVADLSITRPGLAVNSAAMVHQLALTMNFAGATKRLWNPTDETFATTVWNGYMYPAIVAAPAAISLLPQNLMASPLNLTVVPISGSTTSLLATWSAQTLYTGTGLSYSLLVNGVARSVPGDNTVNSFVITGLPSSVPATVAIAVQNSNGVGPYSAVVTATP